MVRDVDARDANIIFFVSYFTILAKVFQGLSITICVCVGCVSVTYTYARTRGKRFSKVHVNVTVTNSLCLARLLGFYRRVG